MEDEAVKWYMVERMYRVQKSDLSKTYRLTFNDYFELNKLSHGGLDMTNDGICSAGKDGDYAHIDITKDIIWYTCFEKKYRDMPDTYIYDVQD